MKGTLPDGTSVKDYISEKGYGNAVIPNWNMINMQSAFNNSALNSADLEKNNDCIE